MTPLSNNEIRKIKSLADKKFRDTFGLFAVEGEKMVDEALESCFQIEDVYTAGNVGEKAMSRISSMSSPSPALAVIRKPALVELSDNRDVDMCVGDDGLFMALDAIRDPGNLGTILRVCDWFGVKAVFASKDTVDVFNPKVVQATMGAIFRVKFHYVDLDVLFGNIVSKKGRVYGTFLEGKDIYSEDLATGAGSPVAILIGNESSGISDKAASLVTDRITIPSFADGGSGSESLNAAVAAAITVAEFRRRTK